jgi:hypothetical protein
VQRLAQIDGPSESILTELVSLSLVSVVPFDFGSASTYYITLQSARGGPHARPDDSEFRPGGRPHGTVDSSFFDIFDVRKGALSGPIVLSDSLIFTGGVTTWSHSRYRLRRDPGVNTPLNRSDSRFFMDTLTARGPLRRDATVGDASVPSRRHGRREASSPR